MNCDKTRYSNMSLRNRKLRRCLRKSFLSRATFNVFSYFIMAYTSSLFSILGTCQINLAYLQNIGVIEVKNWFCCILLFYFKFIILQLYLLYVCYSRHWCLMLHPGDHAIIQNGACYLQIWYTRFYW